MTYYETWEEFPSCRIDTITVTDAPAGVRVVLAEDYDRLRDALERIANMHEREYSTARDATELARDTLQEAGDE